MAPYKTYFFTKASIVDAEPTDVAFANEAALVSTQPLDKDLSKMVSVLLSTGINRNDDVFLAEEVLPARATGAHKPVDLEHNPTKIVGHMMRTYPTRKDGVEISEEDIAASNIPVDFDITSEAVLYKYACADELRSIGAFSDNRDLFVSVEVWFPDYDYKLGNKIIKRNTETEKILDKLLRINGGSGFYNGQRVGRVLREILIGGVGLVKNPANPESIILSLSNDVSYNKYINLSLSKYEIGVIKKEIAMDKNELISCMNEVKADVEQELTEKANASVSTLNAQIEELKTSIVAKDAEIVAMKKEIEDCSAKFVAASAEIDALKLSVAAFELKELTNERTLALCNEFKCSAAKVQKFIQKAINMSKDEFETYVAELREFISVIHSPTSDEVVTEKGGEEQKDSSEAVDNKEVTNPGSTKTKTVVSEVKTTEVVDDPVATVEVTEESKEEVKDVEVEDVNIDSAEKVDVDIGTTSAPTMTLSDRFLEVYKKMFDKKHR